jgi:hypothetical protein
MYRFVRGGGAAGGDGERVVAENVQNVTFIMNLFNSRFLNYILCTTRLPLASAQLTGGKGVIAFRAIDLSIDAHLGGMMEISEGCK